MSDPFFTSTPVAIITGAAGGIGQACVQTFAQAGYRVVMADVDETGRALAESLGDDRCRFIATDVTEDASVRRLFDQTLAAFGALDVLVNNAAALFPAAPLQTTSMEAFDKLVNVNLRGLFLCCKHAYEPLRQSRGAVVNVSSMAGVNGEKDHAIYAATKGAINALTRSMAVDWGEAGIRCNAVCPSSVRTPGSDRFIDAHPHAQEIHRIRDTIAPLGRVAEPAEVAAVILFLASPAASFMSGAVVPVAGGADCGYGIKY